jgi:hypothetical protein
MSLPVTRYLLDTSFFNLVKTTSAFLESVPGRAVYSTHVQRNELEGTSDNLLRLTLLRTYGAVDAEELPTETAEWDDTEWDASKWSAEDGLFDKLKAEIIEEDRKTGKKGCNPFNQSRDARIAETAIRNRLVLVSDDRRLRRVTIRNGGQAITLQEFCIPRCERKNLESAK